MNIDWSKAPEWAVAHALYAFGGAISEVWVGKEQYQRLDQPKPFPYGGGVGDARHNPRRYQFLYETLRPSPWNGEGLPPVGTVCEFEAYAAGNPIWKECRVIAHDEGFAVINYKNNYSAYRAGKFRPIRTPEQIAAEDLYQILNEEGTIADQVNAILKAGYRKQVAP
ncbi:hypothetical protein [Pseudomonas sp. SMN5]|uniref:hypothetical protein n=1 Tax=Pseudomonas sp. SMN5 TaxID=3390198 RepID=UPI003F84A38D